MRKDGERLPGGEGKQWDPEGASDYVCNVFFLKMKTNFDTKLGQNMNT